MSPEEETCCAQEPAACISEQVTLQLVPWSCAFDVLEDPATITCMPAYLQLSTAPGACQSMQTVLACSNALLPCCYGNACPGCSKTDQQILHVHGQ